MSTRRQSSSGLVVGTTKFGQAYGKIRQVLVFRFLEKNRVALALQPRFRTGARGFRPTPRSAPGITRFTHVVPTGQSKRSSALSTACFTLVPPFSKCIDVYEKNGKLTNTIDCAELELLSYPVRVAFSSAEVVFLGM